VYFEYIWSTFARCLLDRVNEEFMLSSTSTTDHLIRFESPCTFQDRRIGSDNFVFHF